MDNGPTTMNGPLHTDEATLDDRAMVASFATPEAAEAAKRALMEAGVSGERIEIVSHAASSAGVQAATQPADQTMLGRIRAAILPEDSETATRAAQRDDEAILTVRPLPQEVGTAVGILQASKPSHFDAALERWRNAG